VTLNLFFSFAWYVMRARNESYHSSRPLLRSSGRSTHGVQRTTFRSAPGGVRKVSCVLFQKVPAWLRASRQLRGATKNQRRSRLIGPPTLTDSSNSLMVLFAVCRPRSLRSCDRLVASRAGFAKRPATIVLNVLPPSFGITFSTTPSALLSAVIPLVDSTISSIDAALS
jgi:hypothetical protein